MNRCPQFYEIFNLGMACLSLEKISLSVIMPNDAQCKLMYFVDIITVTKVFDRQENDVFFQ